MSCNYSPQTGCILQAQSLTLSIALGSIPCIVVTNASNGPAVSLSRPIYRNPILRQSLCTADHSSRPSKKQTASNVPGCSCSPAPAPINSSAFAQTNKVRTASAMVQPPVHSRQLSMPPLQPGRSIRRLLLPWRRRRGPVCGGSILLLAAVRIIRIPPSFSKLALCPVARPPAIKQPSTTVRAHSMVAFFRLVALALSFAADARLWAGQYLYQRRWRKLRRGIYRDRDR